MTNRELVSQISGQLKMINKDDRISRRLILGTALRYSTTLHSQKLLEGTLFREDSLFTKLECVEMEKVTAQRCGLAVRCSVLMRSKEKLPHSVSSRFGNSVIMVTNITDTVELKKVIYENIVDKTTPRYADLIPNTPSWFVFDDYLYIKDFSIEAVNVLIFSLQRDDTANNDKGKTGECTNHWDLTFVCSDKLLVPIMQYTIQELTTTRQIVEDELPDGNSNAKGGQV